MGKFSNKYDTQLTDLKAEIETKIGSLAMRNLVSAKHIGLVLERADGNAKVFNEKGEHILMKSAEYLVEMLGRLESEIEKGTD